jgi:hypothetical protein
VEVFYVVLASLALIVILNVTGFGQKGRRGDGSGDSGGDGGWFGGDGDCGDGGGDCGGD